MKIDQIRVALILDDDEGISELIASLLKDHGLFCIRVSDIKSAIDVMSCNHIDLAFIDISVPYSNEIGIPLNNGVDFVSYLKDKSYQGKFICVSGLADSLTEEPKIKLFDAILSKPFNQEAFRQLLYELTEQKEQFS